MAARRPYTSASGHNSPSGPALDASTGSPNPGPDLSPEGQKRAEAQPDLFVKSPERPDPFPTPDFIRQIPLS